jgi:hypothetical protein
MHVGFTQKQSLARACMRIWQAATKCVVLASYRARAIVQARTIVRSSRIRTSYLKKCVRVLTYLMYSAHVFSTSAEAHSWNSK